MKVLLTGASGFLGSSISAQLDKRSYEFLSIVRKESKFPQYNTKAVGNIDSKTDFSKVLPGVQVVIHAAARAHIMKDESSDPLAEYREVNVAGSANLARQAVSAGVKRFIFISSIKVCGENSTGKPAYKELMEASPEDAYGQSKYEAEEVLKQIAAETGMELVIIRPPLIYGVGVKANFLSLLKLTRLPVPLPFGLIHNQRSMVYLENLVDFILQCIDHPSAAGQTFLISDGQDLSLNELVRMIRRAMNKPAWVVPVPVSLFKFAGKLIGKMAIIDRLIGDLRVDSSKARQLLGWNPPYSVEQGLKETVADFNCRK